MKTSTCLAALTLTLGLGSSLSAMAEPRFAHIFGDHAVLQRDQPVRVWGFAQPHEKVVVNIASDDAALAFQGVNAAADADDSGRWEAVLPALPAGGPYRLSLSGGATLKDILVGDVFLCSGQSNMEFPTRYATNAYNEINASANDRIRFVTVEKDARPAGPLNDLPKAPAWRAAGPQSTGDTSAVCYYMSKAIQAKTGVPVGMIHSSWGGTQIQAWLSVPSLTTLGGYDGALSALKLYATDPAGAKVAWTQSSQDWWRTHEPDAAAKQQWSRLGYDDRKWGRIDTTKHWEDSGIASLKTFDGVIWYRTEITLTQAQAQSAKTIELGAIDDADTSFINGVVIGSDEGWNTMRRYDLPKGVLKAGRNVIAIRAADIGGGGGMWGDAAARGIVLSDGTKLPLPVEWKYQVSAGASSLREKPSTPWLPTSGLSPLYNGMIAPIAPYTVKGVAWYQGESNAANAREYARLLPALFADWRRALKQPDLPFVVVQLAGYGAVSKQPAVSTWAELRETQRLSVNADAHAALAVSIDVGDRFDIHPTQKKIVGDRAALAMRRAAFGEAVALSPEPVSATRQGNDVVIRFRDTGGKLVTYSSDQATGFETCDAQDKCTFADASPEGDTLVLKGAASSVKIRYGWADAPVLNLFGATDLPVSPFEIDVK